MGMQASCASANGVALDAEFALDASREANHGDAVRNLSLGFVDDIHVRIAYSPSGACGWTLDSAIAYARAAMDCYPPPLCMVAEPVGLLAYRFLETISYPVAEYGTWCVHYDRPWRGTTRNMGAPAGRLFARQQQNLAAAHSMRTVDNTSIEGYPLAALAIAARAREMLYGAHFSLAFVRESLSRFGRHPRYRKFFQDWGKLIVRLVEL